MTVVERSAWRSYHLQEVGALGRGERAQGEIVQHEHIELGPRRQEQPSIGAR